MIETIKLSVFSYSWSIPFIHYFSNLTSTLTIFWANFRPFVFPTSNCSLYSFSPLRCYLPLYYHNTVFKPLTNFTRLYSNYLLMDLPQQILSSSRVGTMSFFLYVFFSFIYISWRLITLQYCSGFCYTLTWISHVFTCVPHPEPPLLPPSPSHPSGSSKCPSPEHLSHASNLGWWSVSQLNYVLYSLSIKWLSMLLIQNST